MSEVLEMLSGVGWGVGDGGAKWYNVWGEEGWKWWSLFYSVLWWCLCFDFLNKSMMSNKFVMLSFAIKFQTAFFTRKVIKWYIIYYCNVEYYTTY